MARLTRMVSHNPDRRDLTRMGRPLFDGVSEIFPKGYDEVDDMMKQHSVGPCCW